MPSAPPPTLVAPDELTPSLASAEPVDFPDAPDVDALWHADGPERAWDAVTDFESDLDSSLYEAHRKWGAFDEAAVLHDVYGEHLPRDVLGRLIRRDRRGRDELMQAWRQMRRDGAVSYDERLYWRARGVLGGAHGPGRAHGPARTAARARGAGRPAARAGARRGGDSGDQDADSPGDSADADNPPSRLARAPPGCSSFSSRARPDNPRGGTRGPGPQPRGGELMPFHLGDYTEDDAGKLRAAPPPGASEVEFAAFIARGFGLPDDYTVVRVIRYGGRAGTGLAVFIQPPGGGRELRIHYEREADCANPVKLRARAAADTRGLTRAGLINSPKAALAMYEAMCSMAETFETADQEAQTWEWVQQLGRIGGQTAGEITDYPPFKRLQDHEYGKRLLQDPPKNKQGEPLKPVPLLLADNKGHLYITARQMAVFLRYDLGVEDAGGDDQVLTRLTQIGGERIRVEQWDKPGRDREHKVVLVLSSTSPTATSPQTPGRSPTCADRPCACCSTRTPTCRQAGTTTCATCWRPSTRWPRTRCDRVRRRAAARSGRRARRGPAWRLRDLRRRPQRPAHRRALLQRGVPARRVPHQAAGVRCPRLRVPDAQRLPRWPSEACKTRLGGTVNDRPRTLPIPRVALTREEAAAAVGMSLDSFERHVQPDLRMIRRGKLRLVPVHELERWADESAERTIPR